MNDAFEILPSVHFIERQKRYYKRFNYLIINYLCYVFERSFF